MQELIETYCEVYSTALFLLNIFGGCAVSYEELINVKETVWAEAIQSITGLDSQHILACRRKRIQPVSQRNPITVLDEQPKKVYRELLKLKGQIIRPT